MSRFYLVLSPEGQLFKCSALEALPNDFHVYDKSDLGHYDEDGNLWPEYFDLPEFEDNAEDTNIV